MKLIIVLLLLSEFPVWLWAQKQSDNDKLAHHSTRGVKPPIDYEAIKNWASLGDMKITPDGRYMAYRYSSPKTGSVLTVAAIDSTWNMEMKGVKETLIAGQGRYLVFTVGDSIGILLFKTRELHYIPGCAGLKTPKNGDGKWLAWWQTIPSSTTVSHDKELVVWNTIDDTQTHYTAVTNFVFSDNGKVLLLVSQPANHLHTLQWVDLSTTQKTGVWQGEGNPGPFFFDKAVSKVAFGTDIPGQKSTSARIYIAEPAANSIFINTQTPGMDTGLIIITWQLAFSNDGLRLFFSSQPIGPKQSPQTAAGPVSLDVWHYKDKQLQSEQLNQLNNTPKNTRAVFNIPENRVMMLTLAEGEAISGEYKVMHSDTGFLLLEKKTREPDEKQFSPGFRKASLDLLSIPGNARTQVVDKQYVLNNSTLSPQGKYVVYYDQLKKQWVAYNIRKGTYCIITGTIPAPMHYERNKTIYSIPAGSIMGWLPDDSGVLISDQYDIWEVDLAGTEKPVNITGGYGRRNKLVLWLLDASGGRDGMVHMPGDTLLLKGIDQRNYYEGYYKCVLGVNRAPQWLSSAPYHYTSEKRVGDGPYYLLQRESKVDAPNWFMTSDFKKFRQLTNLQPQKEYNWYQPELLHWKMPDGRLAQGILHKPESFDPAQKYPVIFLFYETAASGIHRFEAPELSSGAIRVPWYTSRNYLVLEPDIEYAMGEPGQSALNTVVSAARYLSTKSWVDAAHMGLSGASFGGYETNYIVSHTTLFAAAAACCGMADLVSDYNGLRGWPPGKDGNQQWVYETNQLRMGATLWERPDLYIKNSPIFKVDKVSTPLLFQQNKEDDAVSWSQGVEWFNALRRLGKKAWMLQYDGEGHGVQKEKTQLDWTIRQEQFFNHYLKGAPAPFWMSKGIPASLKGIDTGLELDISGTTGP